MNYWVFGNSTSIISALLAWFANRSEVNIASGVIAVWQSMTSEFFVVYFVMNSNNFSVTVLGFIIALVLIIIVISSSIWCVWNLEFLFL